MQCRKARFVRRQAARGSAPPRSSENEHMTERIKGILSPVLTPFKTDYSPDADRFVSHCRWLLANDVSLAVFGTNSEANSLSESERVDLLERLVEAGIDPGRLVPGTGCCSLIETGRFPSRARRPGC